MMVEMMDGNLGFGMGLHWEKKKDLPRVVVMVVMMEWRSDL